MNQVKTTATVRVSRTGIMTIIFSLAVIAISFNSKPSTFDGGSIHTPNITLTGTGVPVIITATSASGCTGAVTYQWQQSIDNAAFVDIPNATDTSYQTVTIMMTTYFRRKASCAGGQSVYTNNVATVSIQSQ